MNTRYKDVIIRYNDQRLNRHLFLTKLNESWTVYLSTKIFRYNHTTIQAKMLPMPICYVIITCALFLHKNAYGHTTYSGERCDPDKLTVYRVYLQTAWSRQVFPKQYPNWRPPAQWSKMIGKYGTIFKEYILDGYNQPSIF